MRDLFGSVERVDSRVDSAKERDGVETDGVLGNVRAEDSQHVALREAARVETGGGALNLVGQLAVSNGATRRGFNKRWAVATLRAHSLQNHLCERHVGNRNVPEGAAEDHFELLPSLDRAENLARQ